MSIAEKFEIIADAVYEKGIVDGIQAEWSEFWDSLQQNGTRTNYYMGFASWKEDIFKPKHHFNLTNTQYMFYATQIGNLSAILTDRNLQFDTSQCDNVTYMFLASTVTDVPYIDCRLSSSLNGMFQNCASLATISELKLKDDGSQTFTNTFTNCMSLVNIKITGVIGTDISFSSSSKLTYDSVMSIINALAVVTTTRTITLHATAKSKLTEADIATITQKGWTLA